MKCGRVGESTDRPLERDIEKGWDCEGEKFREGASK